MEDSSYRNIEETDTCGPRKRRCTSDLRDRFPSDRDTLAAGNIVRNNGGVSVSLQEAELWHSFRNRETEMIINRGGRFVLFVSSVAFGACPVSILHKSIADRYRPVRVADGPITVRYRFM